MWRMVVCNGIGLRLNIDTLLNVDPRASPRMAVQDDRPAAISKQRDFLGTKQATAKLGGKLAQFPFSSPCMGEEDVKINQFMPNCLKSSKNIIGKLN